MKKTCTSFLVLLLCVASSSYLLAQIPNESPIPVDFRILSPSTIDGLYDYSSHVNTWGDTLDHTVTGELVWAYSINGDSIGCDEISTDLTGKFAMVRRGSPVPGGTCFFSQKAWLAQQAGAVGLVIANHYANATEDGLTLVNMAAGNAAPWDSLALEVHIPVIFINRNTAEVIVAELDAGNTVEMALEVRSFSDPLSAYAYSTPQSEIVPLDDIGATFINLSEDTIPVTITVEITDPNGSTTTLTETVDEFPALSFGNIDFTETYVPDAVGEYNLTYTNSVNDEVLTSKFEITDFTFAQDNNVWVDWIAPSDPTFDTTYLLVYDYGNFYRTGDSEQVATHVSFALANPDTLYTGDAESDVFNVRIYDADPDGNGTVPNATTYAGMDETNGQEVIVGFGAYTLTGDEEPYEMLTVELDGPVTLEPNKIYLVMIQYNGLSAAIGRAPWYVYGGDGEVAGGLGSAVFTDRFYNGGWSGGYKAVARLHLEGFTVGTVEPLDQSKISVSPNPASNSVKLELSLEKMADRVDVRVVDFVGRQVRFAQLENVKEGAFQFDVSTLPNGTYFMSVTTPEGFRSKKFQVMR